MRYNVVKDAKGIISNSKYVVKNPENYKNNWKKLLESKYWIIVYWKQFGDSNEY